MILYLASLLAAIFACALFWNERVNGILYYCSERYPLDFLVGPPFTHSRSWTTGDHDVARPEAVLWLWRALWAGCILVPAVLVWIGHKLDNWVAQKMANLESPKSLRGLLVSFFRWLAFTALAVGGVSFVIAWNAASQKREPPRRHAPTYSQATITDVPLLVFLGPPKSFASRVAFSPDGGTVAAGFHGRNQGVKTWDSSTGETILNIYQRSVWDVALSPNGEYLAASGHEDTARIYDARTGAVIHSFQGLEIHGTSINFSADGRSVATGNGEGVQIWDMVTGQQIRNLPELRNSSRSMRFSSDGRLLAAGGNDWSVRVWETSRWIELVKFRGHSRGVLGVAFSPDNRRIASASEDGSVKVWDATSGHEIMTFTGHTTDSGARVSAVAFSPDGERAASVGSDGFARVWRTDNAWEIWAFDIGNRRPYPPFLGVAFSPDGKRLATSTGGSTVKIWNVES
jgi:WD40 repeat protein